MTAAEVLLKIKALFERKGVDEAKESVDSLGEAGKEAGASTSKGMSAAADSAKEAAKEVQEAGDAAKTAGEDGAEGLAATGAAADKAAEKVEEVGKSAGEAGESLKAAGSTGGDSFASIAGKASKVTAVLAGVAGIVKMVVDALADMNNRVTDIQLGNLEAGIESTTAALGRQREAYEAGRKEQDAYFESLRQGVETMKQTEIASMELANAIEMSAAKTDEERQAIAKKWDAQTGRQGADADAEDIKVRREAAAAEVASIRGRLAEREAEKETFYNETGRWNQQALDLNAAAGEREANYWHNMAITKPFFAHGDDMARQNADRAAQGAEEYGKLFAEAAKDVEALKAELAAAEARAAKLDLEYGVNRTKDAADRILDSASEAERSQILASAAEDIRTYADKFGEATTSGATLLATTMQAAADTAGEAASATAELDARQTELSARQKEYSAAQVDYATRLLDAKKAYDTEAAQVLEAEKALTEAMSSGGDVRSAAANLETQKAELNKAADDFRQLTVEANDLLRGLKADISYLKEVIKHMQ